MYDRIIYSAWRFIILSMIFCMGCGAAFLMYQGLLAGLSMHFADAAMPVIIGLFLGGAVFWIAESK